METLTTIRNVLAGNKIFVPAYQRAYSWDTEKEKSKPVKQINEFIADLEDYHKSSARAPYYFGHFLFEKHEQNRFGVIDGQQRLTSIVIFLAALFTRLKSLRKLTEHEQELYEDMIKRNSTYHFTTVDYDHQLFRDYVIDQTKKNTSGLDTSSAQRIVDAFDFFTAYLNDKTDSHLIRLLTIVQEASCTTHPVANESEAIQMFIFQNNRGKKPSNLEIMKAQFMFHIHLHADGDKTDLVDELKTRFEKIYKSISSIEYRINEDDVLVYTLRVFFNSLWETSATERVDKILSEGNAIAFIQSFTRTLAECFEYLTAFFNTDEKKQIEIHSLVTLGGIGIAVPFVLKAYLFGLPMRQVTELCAALEILVLRHRLIGTRADITSRLNDVYQKFTLENPGIGDITGRIRWMKDISYDSWWWAYWNKQELERSIQGGLNHTTAKFLLWKYENFLRSGGKAGYAQMRYSDIAFPDLEHIAPQTPTNGEPVAAGYPDYDEEFRNQYVNCLGNYLLLSASHNRSIGNRPFTEKRSTYTYLQQQLEIQRMTPGEPLWTKELIAERKAEITKFIMDHF
ncbi:DUF262 domain-containing protein [Mucilaginibacter mali]|uniref:DUF262 domain-containing protein n=1 Tax=Mucilaginibacter mali TaxID=2740462 RepID=A0A7D4UMG4_9SPHI|nr:DUF262 domain-containing protein [Mucilaginibacter mali]QKJ32862.1 DUF262 domain-containing protein [Mucilaginibacter mali]